MKVNPRTQSPPPPPREAVQVRKPEPTPREPERVPEKARQDRPKVKVGVKIDVQG